MFDKVFCKMGKIIGSVHKSNNQLIDTFYKGTTTTTHANSCCWHLSLSVTFTFNQNGDCFIGFFQQNLSRTINLLDIIEWRIGTTFKVAHWSQERTHLLQEIVRLDIIWDFQKCIQFEILFIWKWIIVVELFELIISKFNKGNELSNCDRQLQLFLLNSTLFIFPSYTNTRWFTFFTIGCKC